MRVSEGETRRASRSPTDRNSAHANNLHCCVDRASKTAQIHDDVPMPRTWRENGRRGPCVIPSVVAVLAAGLKRHEVAGIKQQHVGSVSHQGHLDGIPWPKIHFIMQEVHDTTGPLPMGPSMTVAPADRIARLRMRLIVSAASLRKRHHMMSNTTPVMKLHTSNMTKTLNL